jgi:hypothetical protein
MEFDGTEYNKEHFVKPTVTPERLAEIIWNIIHETTYKIALSDHNIQCLVNALYTTLDIREKE